MHACLYRLYGVVLVVHWRGRARQIPDFIYFDVQRKGDVMADELEPPVFQQVFDIGASTGEVVVDAEYFVPVFQQTIAEV